MTLSDLKKASAARQEPEPEPTTPAQPDNKAPRSAATPVKKPRSTAKASPVADGRTKMLGARVPLAVHREFQQQIFRAQEDYPDLTMQEAVPALIRLLRDEKIWTKFLAELEED